MDKLTKATTQVKILSALASDSTEFTFEDFVNRLGMEFKNDGCKTSKADSALNVLNGMTGLNWCSDPRELFCIRNEKPLISFVTYC